MRLALDWGRARIGVAACDAQGVLAYPVTTIAARRGAVDDIVALVPWSIILMLNIILTLEWRWNVRKQVLRRRVELRLCVHLRWDRVTVKIKLRLQHR